MYALIVSASANISPEPTRVLIAMSGGVDSAVAAARLVDAGYDTVGVTLHLWDYPDKTPEKTRCCAPEDAHDARRVADHLGIPHYTFDRRALFAEQVVNPFVDAYLDGETPSPCVSCNRTVKLRELFALADRLGASAIATGHYARVERDESGKMRLFRAQDDHKDQSYFLHMLSADQLERLILPLGDALKGEVRAEAIRRNLPGAQKGESQELCFVADGNYANFVEERSDGRTRPGAIVDETGKALGQHAGIHRFTVGQRRGLGVALGKPAFVVDIDAEQARVTVGPSDRVSFTGALLANNSWADDMEFPLEAHVKVRSHHAGAPAQIARRAHPVTGEDCVQLRFTEPVRAVSPGQVAVAYLGDRVVGGGTIIEAHRLGDDARTAH